MSTRKHTQPLCTMLLSALLIFSVLAIIPAATTNHSKQQEPQTAVKPSLPTSTLDEDRQAFKPFMHKPPWVDHDNNRVADTLDHEITSRSLNHTAGDYVNVIVALQTEPTAFDATAFAECGGYVTTSPWKYAIYGFGGQIPYNRIADFVQRNPNVLLVEKEAIAHATLAYAASQVGARPYVWNTVGLRGDPNSSIAIVDTGIDDSHPDFSPGFEDQNFTQKIVGWNDQISPGTTSPRDDNGHGSHVSGLAAGTGFFSTDASGNALATWGANLGVLRSDTYLMSGMMVNDTGLITIDVKWKNSGSGTLDTVHLYYGDKTLNSGSWTEVASVNPSSEDTWYTLTYNVASTPSGGYDMYHVLMTFTEGTPYLFDNFYVVFTVSWPYSPPPDEFPAWTGIAPEARLVGVKVLDYTGGGTDTGLLNAIDWMIANREAYHMVIASMSLSFSVEVATVDAAIVNLVNSGVTTIVSAGNSASGGNNIHTPGSVDEVITVAATNQFDNTAHYSSEGGTSASGGNTLKPDITAPGGSFLAVPLFSADSNDGDADLGWSEVISDDGAPMQGTSMSTPVVAGAANIIIQAMGGFANWQYTRSQALLPKMVLLMTATETYPNIREYYTSDSPTLERGGKDVHEGYGRLNLDAAVDALLMTHEIGTSESETLGKPPTLSDISVLGQRLAWARTVQLIAEEQYNFTLTVPSGADFDLYLYNSTGTSYGEPAIVAKSTTATTGGFEQILVTAPYSGTYYLIVKRATATTGGGMFTLESRSAHDIAILWVEPSATKVYAGEIVNITVVVKNEGMMTETFNVTAFYDDNPLEPQTVTNLVADAEKTLTFSWNTTNMTPCTSHPIRAEADVVPGEVDTADNTYVDGSVKIKMELVGDVNKDGIVDIADLATAANAYLAREGDPNYNPDADINEDGWINVIDLAMIGVNYGKGC